MTKTDHIRDYFSCHSLDTSPKVVADFLSQKGIQVTIHHVGMVKKSIRGYSKMKRKANSSGKSGRKSKNAVVIESLIAAKKLLKLVNGDVNAAKKNIETVYKIINSQP